VGTVFSFKANEKRLFDGLLGDLMSKTVKAFETSPEIRRLVHARRP